MARSAASLARKAAYEQTDEYKAKRKARDHKRYEENKEKYKARDAAIKDDPAKYARRKAYFKRRMEEIKADPTRSAQRRAQQALARRKRIYGSIQPKIGQLSLDGKHRFGKSGVAPKKKKSMPLKIHQPKPVQAPVTPAKPVVLVKKVEPRITKAPVPAKAPMPPKPIWVPQPVGTEQAALPSPTIYLCERGTCKRTFSTQRRAREHFQRDHSHD